MSFFKKLFGGGGESEGKARSAGQGTVAVKGLEILQFGRYSHGYKTHVQLDNWNKAKNAFQAKRYVDSFEYLMHYIADDAVGNVTVKRVGDTVEFDLIQGSKKVSGRGNEKAFVAEVNLVEMPNESIPVMRKLMTMNYGLRYSKFALNDSVLCMKFSSHAIDASPAKLEASLKELAKRADKQDDLLLNEFSSLKEIDTEHALPVNTDLQQVKYDMLIQWINDAKAAVYSLDQVKMANGISYILLELLYKIDYLLTPEGILTDTLERMHNMYFKKDEVAVKVKNENILKELDYILGLPKEKVIEGLYPVKRTFGLANPGKHKAVMDFMFKEREKIDWYRKNGYPKIVEVIYGYILGSSFFNYGLSKPVGQLLNLGFYVLNPSYYTAMGDENVFVKSDNSLNNKLLVKAINGILASHKKEFPYLRINPVALRFGSPVEFVDALIFEVDKLNLNKK